jgi:aspartate kinase
MAIIVQKFGGTSVSDISHIQNVSRTILRVKECGNSIVVVVSAMAGVTNQLASYCASISSLTSLSALAEYDAALSSGEVVTASLLSLALQELGIKAVSLSAWQLPIRTSNSFSKALIRDIDTTYLKTLISSDVIPIVTGFQGLSGDDRITTLGRGGSDTTAAALAAALSANYCDIYTDVEGVFTTDPRLVHNAHRIETMCYEEMLEFASAGAKVLHTRSVQIAMRYSIPLRVISSFTNNPGTTIINRDLTMETPKITGIAYSKNVVSIDIHSDASLVLLKLTENNVRIESLHHKDQANTTLLIPLEDMAKAKLALGAVPNVISTDIAILSVIGYGVKNDSTILHNIFSNLVKHEIEIITMTSSEVKISLILQEAYLDKTVKILHESLGLSVTVQKENYMQ